MGLTVSRPSNGQKLTVNRQIKKLIFYRELPYMHVKKFQNIFNLTISADLHGMPAPREFGNCKNQFPCS